MVNSGMCVLIEAGDVSRFNVGFGAISGKQHATRSYFDEIAIFDRLLEVGEIGSHAELFTEARGI